MAASSSRDHTKSYRCHGRRCGPGHAIHSGVDSIVQGWRVFGTGLYTFWVLALTNHLVPSGCIVPGADVESNQGCSSVPSGGCIETLLLLPPPAGTALKQADNAADPGWPT